MFKYLVIFLIIFATFSLAQASFVPTITSEDLIAKYNNGTKIRVLVVPGHDDESSGTEYKGHKEVEFTRMTALKLRNELSLDPHFEVIYAHNPENKLDDGDPGYNYTLSTYFIEQAAEIDKFRRDAIEKFNEYISQGRVDAYDDNVVHVTAKSTIIRRLYGINKWAGENNIDLVVHVHYNDYGGRKRNKPGEYSGFSVYIPEKQFGNAETSRGIGEAIYNRLAKVAYPSNMAGELKHGGVIEDQDLIAVGAHNTLSLPSILVEYGYIYEPWVQSSSREKLAGLFARETYRGIQTYFVSDSINTRIPVPLAPYVWNKDLGENIKSAPSTDVFMLQLALRSQGLFPVPGKDQNDCPITGIFGPCTKSALKTFQSRYNIKPTAYLGPVTRKSLNTVYHQ